MYKTHHARTMPASWAWAGQRSKNINPSPCPRLTHELKPWGPQTRRIPYLDASGLGFDNLSHIYMEMRIGQFTLLKHGIQVKGDCLSYSRKKPHSRSFCTTSKTSSPHCC